MLFENYSHSSSMLSSKNNSTYSEKSAKEQVCLYSWNHMTNHSENEDEKKNISHKYDICRPRSRQGHNYSNYKVSQCGYA